MWEKGNVIQNDKKKKWLAIQEGEKESQKHVC